MLLRVLIVAGSIQPELLRWLLLPLGFAAIAVGALAAYDMRTHFKAELASPLTLKNPFELSTVLKFGAFLAFVMVAAKLLTHWAGTSGAYVLAAVSGIGDVDAVTLSLSRLAGESLPVRVAAEAILLTAAVNSVSKAVLGWEPQWALAHSLSEVVAWHKAHIAQKNMRQFSLEQIHHFSKLATP